MQPLRVKVADGWSRVAGGRGPEVLLLALRTQGWHQHYTVHAIATTPGKPSGRRVGTGAQPLFEHAHALEQSLKRRTRLRVAGHGVGQRALLGPQ